MLKRNKRMWKKNLCLLLAGCMFFTGLVTFEVDAKENTAQDAAYTVSDTSDYREYLEKYSKLNRPVTSIDAKVNTKLEKEGTSTSFTIEADEEGLYQMAWDYLPITGNFPTISVALSINGESQFDSMRALTLDHPWKNETEVTLDSKGNQLRPTQVQVDERVTMVMTDPEGRYNDPLLFYLKKGTNEITITSEYGEFELYGVTFFNKAAPLSYTDLKKEYEAKGYKPAASREVVLLEAEEFSLKSDSSILSESDKTDAATSPSDPVKLLYNYIPGSRYASAGQWVEYSFTPQESGLYQMTLRVRQSEKSGFTSGRRLTINGESVFEELNSLSFVSSNKWYHQTLGGEEAFEFYFEKGKEYKIRLEVIPGNMSQTTLTLDDCIFELNELYRNIVMIAGTNPDKYRDYKIGSEIENFKERVQTLLDTLNQCQNEIQALNGGKSGSALTAIRSLITRLDNAMTRPDSLVQKISSFKSDVESLSAWNMDAKEQPLDLDYIAIHAADATLPAERGSFFKQMWYEVRRLLASFGDDYSQLGDYDEEKETIEVWVVNGRDQMGVINDMVTNEFTPQTGIQVKTSLVTAGINEAILADKAPDVIAYAGSDLPVTLACRGVLEDLSGFDGFDEVSSWFLDGTMDAMEYQGGYYGIPLSQGYSMMFVRTDILEEMGLSIPQTWEEMYEVAAVLQRSNMEVGMPSTTGMYATLLLQAGGEFYSNDYKSTGFDTTEAKEAFETWTDFFTEYSFPVSFDLYNRFRSGEMPIGITSYSFYTQLEQMAPEIAGRWTMVPIPGTVKEDGTIDRSTSISNAAGISTSSGLEQNMAVATMVNTSKHKEASWEFIKWLAEADSQVEYGLGVEAVMGPLGRYTPANLQAFEQMPWTNEQKSLLQTQWKDVVVLKETPGGYAITRNLNNAFRRTIYDDENPVDMLNKYNQFMNKELERKYNEFLSDDK